ncbi:WD repeat-containing protein 7-like isoform X2 [Bolinopsis microptera]|uniref:WD repeat-containing protein 7-like isoform X2 n=1 Tax=Bolinopsis microptera TaxID=2820187 RepID=UPI003078B509
MLLPIVLWGSRPPSHTVSCLFLSRDDKVLISGSTEGQLLVCDVFPEALIPRNFLVGHSTEVVGMDQLVSGLNNFHIISAASNGEVFKWNVTDGSYMLSTVVQGPLIKLQTLPSSQNVLVCGQYGAITVLDYNTLDIKHHLVPSDPTHWVLCYTVFQPPKTKDEEVVCITVNGQIKTWNLQFEGREKMILESETKILNCPRPVCVTYNPRSLYNCLIVCQSIWRIYRAGDFVLLCSGASNQEVPWSGGKFYTVDKIMLWRENGVLYVYQLPARAIRPVDHSDASWSAEPPTLLYSVPTGPLMECLLVHKKSMRTPHDVLIRGDRDGRLSLWKQDREKDIASEGLVECIHTSLSKTWNKDNVALVNEKCNRCGDAVDITASVYLESLSYIACGLSSGDIIVGLVHHFLTHSLFKCTDSEEIDSRVRLKGHKGNVSVLLYPHASQPSSYLPSILYSGGADFSVKIWDWKKVVLLQSFTTHTGPLTRLFLPPTQATGKLRGSVVSVCQDNSITITTHAQFTPLFVGSCHHTGVLEIRWRLTEDILLVHCLDDTVYVWGLSTGHLDRIETGAVALSLVSACQTFSEGEHCKLEIKASSSVTRHSTGLSVVPFSFSSGDNMSHLLLFDTELLLHLLSQLQGDIMTHEFERSKSQPNVTERRRASARADQRLSDRRTSIIKQTETAKLLEERSVISEIPVENTAEIKSSSEDIEDKEDDKETLDIIKLTCSLLLSCLHAWGVDLNIDRTCVKHLGLLVPGKELSYGTVGSSSTFMLLLPGWEHSIQQQSPNTVQAPFGRWCISSTLTTQHLLSVSALANKQMSTDLTLSFNRRAKNNTAKREDKTWEREERLRQSINESEKKAGWSHVTALHCIVLPEHVPPGYCSPLLTHLALKWQDRCMEVREASQALFLRELRRIGFTGRQQLVNQWYPYIVRKRDINPPEPLEKVYTMDLPLIPEYFAKFINRPEKSRSSVSVEDEDLPADSYPVSVIILGVIVSEFPDEVEVTSVRNHVTSQERRDVIRSSFLLTHDMLRGVAAHLFSQLIKPPSQLPLHSPIRRASVDLIGRGFGVWCEFVNLTAVVMTLLELQTDPLVPIEVKKAIAQSGNIPGTGNKECLAAAATVRAAYQASILIANNRPQQTVTALSKEIMTFKCDVEAGLSIQSLSVFPSSYHTVLDKGRYPIYLLVQNIIEKTKVRDLAAIIVKIVEIMLFCIDTDQFKTRTLSELVPSLTKNVLIDYCAATQQVVVGSAEGLVHVFDVKNTKCTPLHAHNAPTSAVSLATNGRTLVTFSENEGRVSIWQSSSGLLSLMSPGPLKLVRVVDALPPLSSNHSSKSPLFKWEATKLVSLYLSDGTKKSFAV